MSETLGVIKLLANFVWVAVVWGVLTEVITLKWNGWRNFSWAAFWFGVVVIGLLIALDHK